MMAGKIWRGSNKYNAKRVVVDGIKFDSKREAHRYKELKLMERAGTITDLQLQPKFELQPGFTGPDGRRIRAIHYIGDFMYTDLETGNKVVEDVKGVKTDVYKLKKKMMAYVHSIEIVEV